jgi:tol-pal system protein YbgF
MPRPGASLAIMLLAAGLVPAAAAQDDSPQGDSASGELVYEVQALLEEVRYLRGQVEAQQRAIENLRRRQRDQYLDLDQRLQALEQGGGETAAEAADEADARGPTESTAQSSRPQASSPVAPTSDSRPQSGSEVPEVRAPLEERPDVTPLEAPAGGEARELEAPSESEKAAYDAAFRALRETRYADAAEAFSAFLDDHPDSSYAPNALYWLAETYYVTGDFRTALEYFNELLDRFPGSSKEGDALLKIGFTHYELEQWNEARAALEQVRSQFPGTTLARLAEGRLRDMRLAGHY